MGCFDSVWVNCPECLTLVEFQSKAGDCALADYDLLSAPMEVLGDILNDCSSCQECGRVVSLRKLSHPLIVVE